MRSTLESKTNTIPSVARCTVLQVLIVLFFINLSEPLLAQAPDPKFQYNWHPNEYKFVCDPPDACDMDDVTHRSVEELLKLAVQDIRPLNFRSPTWWANRKTNGSDGHEYMELYESRKNNVAFVSCQSYQTGGQIVQAIMNIGNKFSYFKLKNAEYWTYNSLSHEIFHLSQYEYPFWDPSKCGNVPGWVMESTATAFATEMMRKRYPSAWPSMRNKEEARDMAGLRRYDEPLPVRIHNESGEVTSGLPIYQRISSFWRHVANVHHQGKYDFLAQYMMTQASFGDWVAWLRNNVRNVSGSDLGMVFGGFLADFAGWGDPGFPGKIFGRKEWLQEAFNGCENIYLNKQEPVDYVDVDLKPLSGDCIEVVIATMGPDGIKEGESAAVQVAAMIMSGPPSSRGGIHLGLAGSNDKHDFLCAREVKKNRKMGLGKCVFVPDDGKIRFGGGSVDARVWNVVAQEKNDPTEIRQEPGADTSKGELKNLYTVSYTPTSISMRDSRYDNNSSITVRIYFSLDVTTAEINGNQSATTGPGKKRTVGSFGEGGDPQTTLPKWDANGNLANSFSLPEQFRPVMPAASVPGEFLPGKLSLILVGQQLWDGNSSASDTLTLSMNPARQTGEDEYELISLDIGDTGSFQVIMTGNLAGEHLSASSLGQLEVEEFTDLTFRARFSGTLCRTREVEPGKECDDPVQASGRIVKAFAGTRLPGNYMTIERTPGTEIYRKAAEQGLAEWSLSTEDADAETPGGEAPVPTAPGSLPQSFQNCACTCEERAQMNQTAEELKARKDAGEEVGAGEIMGLARCQKPCQREYMMCIMDENDRKDKAKQARVDEDTKLLEKCACTCETLKVLTLRQKQLETELKPGDHAQVNEIMSISSCYQSCMTEFMSCQQ